MLRGSKPHKMDIVGRRNDVVPGYGTLVARPNTVRCIRVRERWKAKDGIPCNHVEKGTKGPLTIIWLLVDLYSSLDEGRMCLTQPQLKVRDAAWRNCSGTMSRELLLVVGPYMLEDVHELCFLVSRQSTQLRPPARLDLQSDSRGVHYRSS